MGSGGVAIAALPTVICFKVTFSDGLGGDGWMNGCGLPPSLSLSRPALRGPGEGGSGGVRIPSLSLTKEFSHSLTKKTALWKSTK